MKPSRGPWIFGGMMLFGLAVACIYGEHPLAGPATLAALIVGGFAGEWFREWREDRRSLEE